jgi:hypothetical protein
MCKGHGHGQWGKEVLPLEIACQSYDQACQCWPRVESVMVVESLHTAPQTCHVSKYPLRASAIKKQKFLDPTILRTNFFSAS